MVTPMHTNRKLGPTLLEEADNVFVLDPDSLPLIRRDSKPWQIQQERNLCYIAATRAKRVLTFEGRIPSIFRS